MTLDKLATRLGVIDRQLRVKDQRTIVAIAGVRGLVKAADDGGLIVTLYPDRTDALARRALLDAGVIIKLYGSTDLYRLQRLPNGSIEREAFATLLGLTCKREVAS